MLLDALSVLSQVKDFADQTAGKEKKSPVMVAKDAFVKLGYGARVSLFFVQGTLSKLGVRELSADRVLLL